MLVSRSQAEQVQEFVFDPRFSESNVCGLFRFFHQKLGALVWCFQILHVFYLYIQVKNFMLINIKALRSLK